LRDYLPTSDNKARFISECERVERNKAPPAKERDDSDNDCKSNKKTKFAKSEKSATKSGQKTDTESGPKYCTHCTLFETDFPQGSQRYCAQGG
jgi:hypothetical protein